MDRRKRTDGRIYRIGIAVLVILVAGWLVVQSSVFSVQLARYQTALGYRSAAIETLQSVESPPSDTEISLARLLALEDRCEESLEIFNRVGFDNDSDLEVIGRCFARLGRWTEAIPALEKAQEKTQLSSLALCDLADSYACLGMYEESRSTARKLRDAGDEVMGLYRLGLLDFEQNLLESCVQNWGQLLNLQFSPDEISMPADRLWMSCAAASIGQGNAVIAGRALERLLPSPQKSFLLGELAELEGRPDDAVRVWEEALRTDSTLDAARRALSKYYVRDKRYLDAVSVLTPLSGSPETLTVDVCNILQLAYTGLGQTEEAELWKKRRDELELEDVQRQRLARRATDPGTAEFRVLRAWKLASLGSFKQAQLLIDPILRELPARGKVQSPLVAYVRLLSDALKDQTPIPDPHDHLIEHRSESR